MEMQEIHQKKLGDNVGTCRTENWPTISNFLIGLVHQEFSFLCARPTGILEFLYFHDD